MRKNKVIQKILMEAVGRLSDLQDDYYFAAEMNKANGKDINTTIAKINGIQDAKEELYVLMEKYE